MTYDRHLSRTLRIVLDDLERSQPAVLQMQSAVEAAAQVDTQVLRSAVEAASQVDTLALRSAVGAASQVDTLALRSAVEAAAQVDTRVLRSAVEAAATVDTRALHQMVESMTDLQELRGAIEELPFDETAFESEEGSLDSTEETETGSPSPGEVRTRALLIMFVLWVWVTPYLSAQQMAEFVGWWIEVVAALLSGS